jgi:excisionase family DNA binding protein
MTAGELADYFGISKSRVYRMLRREADAPMFGFRVGKGWRIDLDQMRDWMCQQIVEKAAGAPPKPSHRSRRKQGRKQGMDQECEAK